MLAAELRVNGALVAVVTMVNVTRRSKAGLDWVLRQEAEWANQHAEYDVTVHDLQAGTTVSGHVSDFNRSRGAVALLREALKAIGQSEEAA